MHRTDNASILDQKSAGCPVEAAAGVRALIAVGNNAIAFAQNNQIQRIAGKNGGDSDRLAIRNVVQSTKGNWIGDGRLQVITRVPLTRH